MKLIAIMTYTVPNSLAHIECVEFRQNSPRDHYGRLVLGPLAPGQGVTLGNTFRRLMLNDLPGVAITAAKLNNARTEFTTLPGIRESVVEIFLNLRDVTFFNQFPEVLAPRGRITVDPLTWETGQPTEPKLLSTTSDWQNNPDSSQAAVETIETPEIGANSSVLDISNTPVEDPTITFPLGSYTPRYITAGDMELPPGICCVDPSQHIATLVHDQAYFDATFVIEQGTGYRVWKKPTQPQGSGFHPPRSNSETNFDDVKSGLFQPIDGNFMPVKSVNFMVEDMPPVGEYVHFEIITNGSIHPKEAFKQAGAVLAELTRAAVQEVTYESVAELESTPTTLPGTQAESEYFHTIYIEQLELSLRAYNCLKRAQILTLADLARQSYQDLLSLRNFGQKSAEEVRKALATYGVELKQTPESL
jgi:DNA-directed RNA polymerase alpha subunit